VFFAVVALTQPPWLLGSTPHLTVKLNLVQKAMVNRRFLKDADDDHTHDSTETFLD
jgi:hypothetical protein